MTYRIPISRDDARVLEWESLVGQLGYGAEDIKRHVENRNYADFNVDATSLRSCIDELQERMSREAVVCSVCGKVVKTDPRGDVLDSSGRCDTCRP